MEEQSESSGKKKSGTIAIPPNSTATRPSLKSDSQFNNYHIWKQKLRENCYKRVRQDRTRLLWKFRTPTSQSHNQQQLDIAFRDIVSNEFNKIIKHDHDDIDMLWDDEGPCTTYQGVDDCQEILLEMQRIFYQDLESQPPIHDDQETAIDPWDDEVDDYLARAVYEHMQLNDDNMANREEIWCPLCKQGELKDSHSLIYCTRCELKLTKASELTLDFLRNRLAEVHMEHLDRGCRLKPKFCMKTKFNLTALYITCEGCDTFEVIS